MKITYEMIKKYFTVKEIFIIAIIVIIVLMLSYDGDTDDADNYKLGFPIETLNK